MLERRHVCWTSCFGEPGPWEGALVALAAGVAEVAFAGGAAAGVAVDARVLRTGRLLGDVVGL